MSKYKADMQTKIDPVPPESREAQGLFFHSLDYLSLPISLAQRDLALPADKGNLISFSF